MNKHKLPPLPEIPLLQTRMIQIRDFTLDEMKSYATLYGQTCAETARRVAVEECERLRTISIALKWLKRLQEKIQGLMK